MVKFVFTIQKQKQHGVISLLIRNTPGKNTIGLSNTRSENKAIKSLSGGPVSAILGVLPPTLET